ncbi:response regulator [Candidatus Hydrogenedentota bacterium]
MSDLNATTNLKVLDFIPLGVCVLRRDSTVIFWNKCLEDWTEISRDIVVGTDLGEHFPHFNAPVYRDWLETIFNDRPSAAISAQLHGHIFPARLLNGKLRHQNTTVSAMPALNGDGCHALIIVEDVTELTQHIADYHALRDKVLEETRQHEEAKRLLLKSTRALQESEERLDMAMSAANDGMWDWDIENDVVYFDPRYYTMAGYEPDEFPSIFQECEKRVHPDDIGQTKVTLEAYLTGESDFYDSEFRFRRKSGEWMWIRARGDIVTRDENGEPLRMVGTHTEITDFKTAEQRQRAAQDFQRRILETAATAVFTVDSGHSITTVNREFCDLTGFSEVETIGQNCKILCGEPCMTVCELYDSERTEPIYRRQSTIQAKDGRRLTILKNADITRDEKGNVTGGIESFIDVTELVHARESAEQTSYQLEDAVRRANDMAIEAEMATAAKSEFLANMSHEIRTPMNGVIGMTGLLLDTKLTSEQRQFGEAVRNSADALLTLINDILDFSKIEAGKLDMETLDFDLRTTFEDFADTLVIRAQEKGLEFNCLIHSDVPSLLRGDPGRLRQVLMNLTGNAIKFTTEGEVAVVAELGAEDDDRVNVRFSIHDTGIGIPKARQEALFEPFIQADGTTTREYGGTGLGLTISKQLTEIMGGEIGVESVKGEGSTFWFTAVFEKQPADAQPALSLPSDVTIQIKDMRVLAVDNNETNRQVVGGLLDRWGFRHDEVGDGQTALDALAAAAAAGDPYRAAILDMRMPKMDGEELGKRIKADPALANTHLIMMTSFGKRGDAARIREIGFEAYLPKPIKQSVLFDCLATVLMGEGLEEGGAERPLVTRHTVAEGQRANVRILLAEDNITNQQVALAILRKLGYRTDAVGNGEEAVKALVSIPYDLVLMDCQMPIMDGYRATRQIRNPLSDVHDHNVPIVAMTANTMKGDREKCFEAGMNDYVAKPIRGQELLAAIERCLASQQTAPSYGNAHSTLDPRPSVPVFDPSVLLGNLDGDEELLKTIIDGFLEDIPREIGALKKALEENDAPLIERQAHTIKGASANVGAEALRQVASEAENAAKAGNLEKAASQTLEIEEQFEILKEAILRRKS